MTTDAALRPSARVTPHGAAAIVAGLIVVVLGAIGAINSDLTGPAWFLCVVPAALLFVVGLLGARRLAGDSRVAGRALLAASVGMTLFAAGHVVAFADEGTGILLFNVFMVVSAVSLIVAGVALLRSSAPRALGGAVLATGVWPLLIPAGAALGDVLLFSAIAVWGITWVVLGGVLVSR